MARVVSFLGWDTVILYIMFLTIKLKKIRGDLTGMLAKTLHIAAEVLVPSHISKVGPGRPVYVSRPRTLPTSGCMRTFQ